MERLTVKRDSDGAWFCRPYLGTNAVTRKPMRPYKRFPAELSEEEALARAQEWVNGLAAAAELHTTMHVSDVLARYIDMLAVEGRSPNTVETYRSLARCYVDPYIGGVDVRRVKAATVDDLYKRVGESGSKSGGPVSGTTLAKLHWFLRGAWKYMEQSGIVDGNVMASVVRPRGQRREAAAFNGFQYSALRSALRSAMSDPSTELGNVRRRNAAMCAALALLNGERCGEACANVLGDANMMAAKPYMHVGATMVETSDGLVRKTSPKSKSSVRNVTMPADLADAVRDHVEWQASYLPKGVATSSERPLCCLADGGFMRPSAVSREFSRMRRELGLPDGTSFHTLRHTHATYLLYRGVDMRTVSERLGHSKVSTTMDIYAHVLPGRDAEAAAAFDGDRGGGDSHGG